MKKLFIAGILAAAAFTSCKKDKNQPQEKMFKGTSLAFQHGNAWTWYEVDDNGQPLKLGLAVDDAAMNSLDTSHPGSAGHHHVNMISLALPAKAMSTPFNHIELGWNPQGHEPEQIYGKPHFDFHFYMTTPEAVSAIPLYEADSSKFLNVPGPGYLPPTYFTPGGGVPQMGVHWLDGTSPELNGAAFTQTFIYGSYDGKVTFYEPMITQEFIKTHAEFERAIPQPAKFQKTGYYPTTMRISKANGVTNIVLTGFTLRQAQ